MEMNFCRRCGADLTNVENHVYKCKNEHVLFANASPTACAWIVNNKNEVLVTIRSSEPGKGLLDMPGGFNDGVETFEATLARELEEELGLASNNYTPPQYLMSALDKYPYKGEAIDAISAVFWTRIIGNPTIIPNDDVAEAIFMPIADIDHERLYFQSARESLTKLQEML